MGSAPASGQKRSWATDETQICAIRSARKWSSIAWCFDWSIGVGSQRTAGFGAKNDVMQKLLMGSHFVSPSGLECEALKVRWLTPPAGDVSPSGLKNKVLRSRSDRNRTSEFPLPIASPVVKRSIEAFESEGWQPHPIAVRLSPLTIRCAIKPKMTLEAYWQERKCLVVYVDSEDETGFEH
jgi:hypothetical protein